MNTNIFSSGGQSKFWLDPRTKILLLIVINVVLIGGGISGVDSIIRFVLALLPLLLLLLEQKYQSSILYLIFISLAMGSEFFLVSETQGVLNLILVIASGLISRFVPSLVMGYYVVTTTKISEFVAAMERMHVPQKIIIPFSVMLRFFPTVGEENMAISDAMKMRGIQFGGKNATAMIEYRVIPMLISTVRIGEELSAAALTRGLGKPTKRTNICEVGFSILDVMCIVFAVTVFSLWIIF
ncbi:MAG: energy-coupling factor transporter transmembrane protein EcfT [Tissierellales bacterium]|nr:energy-coupling factor transporter transmembrane protein EcfT [Tissierellales bacterium]